MALKWGPQPGLLGQPWGQPIWANPKGGMGKPCMGCMGSGLYGLWAGWAGSWDSPSGLYRDPKGLPINCLASSWAIPWDQATVMMGQPMGWPISSPMS